MKLIFITKTSHLASLWNGGWGELGNGLLAGWSLLYALVSVIHPNWLIRRNFRLRVSDNLRTDSLQNSWTSTSKMTQMLLSQSCAISVTSRTAIPTTWQSAVFPYIKEKHESRKTFQLGTRHSTPNERFSANEGCLATDEGTTKRFRVPDRNRTHDLRNDGRIVDRPTIEQHEVLVSPVAWLSNVIFPAHSNSGAHWQEPNGKRLSSLRVLVAQWVDGSFISHGSWFISHYLERKVWSQHMVTG